MKKRKAFTLAEVLITLGVIGIIAAMTLPTLVQNYQKNLTTNRLKHFSSLMQQAVQMRKKDEIDGNFKTLTGVDVLAFSPDDMEKYVNIYLKPYIKILSMKKMTKGMALKFANSSGVYIQKSYNCTDTDSVGCNLYMLFCPQYKYCERIDESKQISDIVNSKYIFVFWNSGTVPREYVSSKFTREELLQKCKNIPYYCSSLIEYDGWEIKDDYPW